MALDTLLCITLGFPDPPADLEYNVRESLVDLQWTRPSYAGGVVVVKYDVVSENNKSVTVDGGMERVQYSALVYGEVNVTAINFCGQESTSATINISASGNLTAIYMRVFS